MTKSDEKLKGLFDTEIPINRSEPSEETKAALDLLDQMIERGNARIKALFDEIESGKEVEIEIHEAFLRKLMKEEMFIAWLVERKKTIENPFASQFLGRSIFGGGIF